MNLVDQIEAKLVTALEPTRLELKNVSHLHEGHAGHDGSGESHFKLLIISKKFEGLSRLDKQRMVYDILAIEMKTKIHALSIKAFSVSDARKIEV